MTPQLADYQLLMLRVIRELGDNAYGVTIRQRLEELSSSAVIYGDVYATLVDLEHLGLIASHTSNAPSRRQPAQFWLVTVDGLRILDTLEDS